jgi:Putative phage tail protein
VKSFRVRFYANPFEESFAEHVQVFDGSLIAEDLPDLLKITARPLEIRINGVPCVNGQEVVNDGDDVYIGVQAKFETLVAVFTFLFEAAGAGFYAAGAYATIAAAVTIVAGTIILQRSQTPNFSRDQLSSRTKNDRPSYSLTSSANQARLFEPMPVIMGAWRYVPDYDTRPWSQYVAINNPPVSCQFLSELRPQPAKQSPADYQTAVILAGSPAGYGQDSLVFGSNQPIGGFNGTSPGVEQRSGLTIDPSLSIYGPINPFPATWVMRFADQKVTPYRDAITELGGGAPATWVDWSEARPDNPIFANYIVTGGLARICNNYNGYEQQISQIVNFGFGDLDFTDWLVGNTPITEYTDVSLDIGSKARDDSYVSGHPNEPYYFFGNYPLNCVTRDGADLSQKDSPPDLSKSVVRTSPKGCKNWQIDIAGSVFGTNQQGYFPNSVEVQVEYAIAGSNSWIVAAGSPFTVAGADSSAVRRTFGGLFPSVSQYDLRITKLQKDSESQELYNKIQLQSVKFFQEDGGIHPAQNRVGIVFQSSSSLNGTIDAVSAYVYAKTWVWTGGTYSGQPIGSTGWSWQHTESPAWWCLYWALGGFTNKSFFTLPPFAGRGWNLGDHPANEQRLFGCGIPASKIDVYSAIAFANFCTRKNLKFSAAVIEQSGADEVLRRIARVGRGTLSYNGSKLAFVWEDENQPIIAQFGMSNIIAGSFRINYASARIAEEIVTQFVNPEDEWRQSELRVLMPGITVPAHEARLDLWGVKYRDQALREANRLAAAQFYNNRRITWQSDMQGARITKMSVVALAHDLTQWAYSGRFIELVSDGSRIVSAKLSMEAVETQPFIMIQLPDATQKVLACSMIGRDVTFTDTWAVADAPEVLGITQNAASRFVGTVPEDFYFVAGPTATPGKRVRIIDIQPSTDGLFTFTAEDDVAEAYAREYDPEVNAPAYNYPADPVIGSARVYDLTAQVCDDQLVISWARDNCAGATITIQQNGQAAFSVNATGESLSVAKGSVGDVWSIGAVPYGLVTFAQNTGDFITYTQSA